MTAVGAFVHLYHIWALWGALTAFLYGKAAYKGWRSAGGTWDRAPADIFGSLSSGLKEAALDWGRLFRWAFASFSGLLFRKDDNGRYRLGSYWPKPTETRWPANQMLLIGITLGGLARLMTGLYWAELNTLWMNEASVYIPPIPIIIAILADLNHQYTAWPSRPWIPRLLASAAVVWVLLGAFNFAI